MDVLQPGQRQVPVHAQAIGAKFQLRAVEDRVLTLKPALRRIEHFDTTRYSVGLVVLVHGQRLREFFQLLHRTIVHQP
ncbi:hypothetical protein D3C86_2159620 [compost metagenome]